MSGIYFHIPFCKQACHYCDFHFSTNLRNRRQVLEAMHCELKMRAPELQGSVSSIYFGGGTPSLLTPSEISVFLDAVHRLFSLTEDTEITLEANPDDIEEEKLRGFRAAGVNRLSIGIQTFHEPHLKFMNRAHNAEEALTALSKVRAAGFSNLTADLIYGLPSKSHDLLKHDLEILTSLNLPHISAYCLTIESKTAFGRKLERGQMTDVDDNFANEQFDIVRHTLENADYLHYETSNFAKPWHYSKHNTAYWFGEPYLGIGPGAHSFDGKSRRSANVSNNRRYTESFEKGKRPAEIEHLSSADLVNEALITRLRTLWGLDTEKLRQQTGIDLLKEKKEELEKLLTEELISQEGYTLKLTDKAKFTADFVSLRLFIET